MLDSKRTHTAVSADISPRTSDPRTSPLAKLGAQAFFRARDAAELGVDSRALRQLADEGAVERIARGLYRITAAEPTEHYSVAAVCARVPEAIVCLLTALNVYELGTQLPRKVWIGIPHKARAPRAPELPIRVVRFSGASLRYGVVDTTFEGVPARITTPARTVVDCFRFHRHAGKVVALQALRDAIGDGKADRGSDLASSGGLPCEGARWPGPGGNSDLGPARRTNALPPGSPCQENSAMPSVLSRTFLFLSSYLPLFLIFTILAYSKYGRWALLPLGIGVVATLGLALFLRWVESTASHPITIVSVQPKDAELLAHLFAYVFPFLRLDLDEGSNALALSVFFLVLMYLNVTSNMIHINPTLRALGYHLYRVTPKDGEALTLLTRRPRLHRGTRLKAVMIGDDISMEKGAPCPH